MEWQNKRKPTDRLLDKNLLERIGDDHIFQRMQDVESSLDALVQRKRLDLQDMIGRSMRKNETIRLFISSQVFNQAWQKGTVFNTDESNPHWTLRIEGKLLNENPEQKRPFSSMITSVIVELKKKTKEDPNEMQVDEEPKKDASIQPNTEPAQSDSVPAGDKPAENTSGADPAQDATGPSPSTPAASAPASGPTSAPTSAPTSGPTSATPTPNPATEPETNPTSTPAAAPNSEDSKPANAEDNFDEIVEWHETCVPPEQRVGFDGLDVKRSGTEPVEATIYIQLKEYPDKFKLSPELAAILGVSEESKPGAVVSLWQYIRYHNLQDVDEKRLIKCDGPLYNLIKREKIMLPHLVELLAPHLSPREPIKLQYTIDPTQDMGNRDIAFDVPIQVDHPLRAKLIEMLNMWHSDQVTISHYEDLLLQDVQALNLLEYQREFYEDFAKDPVKFLEKWTASQMRDLKVIYCDRQFSEETVRQSSFYTDDLINANLHLFLDKN